MNNRRVIPLVVYLLVLVLVFSWANKAFGRDLNQVPYSKVVELLRQEQVRKFVVEDQTITLYLRAP